MKSLEIFEDEHFRFYNEEFQFLRSKFPFKKIPVDSIVKITIKKGIRVKHPIRLLAFGIIMTFASLYTIYSCAEFSNKEFDGELSNAYRFFGFLIMLIGFLFALGGIAIFQSVF